ncbi:MAG: hypothetical protein J6T74_02290 [Clostridia bacterium]|nr:hypothetical protein [Clostridia bacterium]
MKQTNSTVGNLNFDLWKWIIAEQQRKRFNSELPIWYLRNYLFGTCGNENFAGQPRKSFHTTKKEFPYNQERVSVHIGLYNRSKKYNFIKEQILIKENIKKKDLNFDLDFNFIIQIQVPKAQSKRKHNFEFAFVVW